MVFHILVAIMDIQVAFIRLSRQVIVVEDILVVVGEDIHTILMEGTRVKVDNFEVGILVVDGLNVVDIQVDLTEVVFHIMVMAFLPSMVIHELILRVVLRLDTL